MGLDMYLTKKIYIGTYYKHRKITGKVEIFENGELINIDFSKISEISERTAYWRKANQIHRWFVNNVQEGEDDCKEYYVSFEKLTELKNLCKKVLKTKDVSLLPPSEGFFFGSTEINEYYWGDLQETIDAIESADPKGEYYYQSSW